MNFWTPGIELKSGRSFFYEYLEYKYKRSGMFSLVIAGDDDALQFVIRYRYSLFKNIPVVYLGIDSTTRLLADSLI